MARHLTTTTKLLQAADDYEPWLRGYFPRAFSRPEDGTPIPFGPMHHELWRWVWALTRGIMPSAFLGCWFRGSGKSTGGELVPIVVGARKVRTYVVYLMRTQEQADAHVANISAKLESPMLMADYPDLCRRSVNKYGTSKGWRRNRLRTASGLTIDAMGLDSARRGAKIDDDRPDLIIPDDIDDVQDSDDMIARNINTFTKSILPAGSPDVAVLYLQNRVIPHGIMGQLLDGTLDALADRHVSRYEQMLDGFAYDAQPPGSPTPFRITSGHPVWDGLTVADAQRKLNTMGLSAFRAECQGEVEQNLQGMFAGVTFRHCAPADVPDLVNVQVWLDPAVEDDEDSDCCGLQADGIAADGTLYRLFSHEERMTPLAAMRFGVEQAVRLKANVFGVETNQGGDLWRTTFDAVCVQLTLEGLNTSALRFASAKADSGIGGKAHRTKTMLADYEGLRRIVHVLGTHTLLEAGLTRYLKKKPFDLVDAAFWSWHHLTQTPQFVFI